MYSFYRVFVIAGYYLTGLGFAYFAHYFRQRPVSALTGAISYVFCGFALFTGVRHPHFMMPMLLLPLLVTGTEKVMRGERSWLLTAAVFVSVTSLYGVYFSCMQAVFVCLYVCVRFFDLYRQDRLRQFVRLCGRMLLWAGTGALLGCFTALPTFLQILSGSRVGADIWGYTDPFFYHKDYYLNFLTRLFVRPESAGSWMYMGFSALCLPALALLFIRRDKKTRTLRVLFLILTVMHMIPAAAYVLSGFSNVSNRFCFGYAFCMAAILTFMLPELERLSGREALKVWSALGVYVALCLALGSVRSELVKTVFSAAALLAAWTAVAVCLFRFRGRLRSWAPAVCLLVTCVSVGCSAFARYDGHMGNYVGEFYDDTAAQLEKGQYASLAASGPVRTDSAFFRVAGDKSYNYEQNYATYYGLNGTSAYPFYGQSADYAAWLGEMEAPRTGVAHRFNMFVRQSELLTLSSVKYYASRSPEQSQWPYGFQKVDEITKGEDTDAILKNENWLPLGYTYDRYILREDYDGLDAPHKREAQLQAVVLDASPDAADVVPATDLSLRAEQVPGRIAASDGVTWKDGTLRVKKAGATMTLAFEGLPETETYLRVKELDLTKGESQRSWNLTAETDTTTASGHWTADAYVYANRQHTQLLDLGYSEEGMTSVTLTFPKKGTFKLEDLQIWCQPMDGFAAQTAVLRAEPLEDIRTNWRGLTGTVSVSKDKILCLSLPWLDGWTAYVDGVKTPLLHANTAFMGVELPAGEHTVELRYWMPGLTAGLALTGLGGLCLAGRIVFDCRKKKAR